jgi:hypothetical protein
MRHFNIEIQKGVSYELTLTFVDSVTFLPVDLTGYQGALSVTPAYSQGPAILLTVANQFMALNDNPGEIRVYFHPDDTSKALWDQAPFSLSLTSPENKKSLLMTGFVTVVNTPFMASTNPTGSGSGSNATIMIPGDQAYWMYNPGTDVGSSGSYFAESNIDWSI